MIYKLLLNETDLNDEVLLDLAEDIYNSNYLFEDYKGYGSVWRMVLSPGFSDIYSIYQPDADGNWHQVGGVRIMAN